MKKILFFAIILSAFSTYSQSVNRKNIEYRYDSIFIKIRSLEERFQNNFSSERKCIEDRITSLKEQESLILKHKNAKESPSYKNAQKQIGLLSQEADSCFSSINKKFNALVQNNKKNKDSLKIKNKPQKALDNRLLKINSSLKKRISELNKSNESAKSEINYLKNKLIKEKNATDSVIKKLSSSRGRAESWFYSFILIILLVFVVLFFVYKKILKQKKSIKDLNDNLNKKNEEIKSLGNQTQKLLEKINSIKAVTQNSSKIESKSIFSPLSHLSNDKTPSFLAESFVTAGPRKNYIEQIEDGDIDLGEDVAGFLVKGNYAAFWVLDGTSGQDKLYSKEDNDRIQLGPQSKEYFSSRLLAQNIAWNLHSLIKQNGLEYSSFMLLKQAIENTQTQWQENINKLKEEDKLELKQILETRNMVLCSTTVAFGIITMNKELDLTVSGDCVVITQPNPIEIPPNNRRQSANIYLKSGKIIVNFNDLKESSCVIKNATGIEKVIAMSDGISKTTQKWISSNINIDFTNPQIRESLARLQQKSMDDKSISIIQII